MKKKEKRGLRNLIMIILALVIILGACYIDSNRRLTVTEYDVYSDRLPEAFEGFRIVQLSDLHGAVFGEGNEKLLDKIRAAEPDIIAVTGDMFDENTDEGYAPELTEQLCEIAPVYYVSGNHEWVINPRNTFKAMEAAGAKVMRNEYETLTVEGETAVLAGADDPNGPYDMKTKDELVGEIKAETDDYIIMLSHRNTDLDLWASLGVDLVLCGHAHGGFIRLPFVGGILRHREEWDHPTIEGVFEKDSTVMIVSRGIGSSGKLALRLFNNPEIVVAVLHAGEK